MNTYTIAIDRALLSLYHEENYKHIAKDDYIGRLNKQLSALKRLCTLTTGKLANTMNELVDTISKVDESKHHKDFIVNRDVYTRIIDTSKTIMDRMSSICSMITTKDLIDAAIVEELNDSITSKYTILTTKDLLSGIDNYKPISVQGLQPFLQMIIDTHRKLSNTLASMIKKLSKYIEKQTKLLDTYTNDVSTHSDDYTGLGNNLPNQVDRFKDSIRSIELLIKSTDVCIGNITVLTSAISKHWQ